MGAIMRIFGTLVALIAAGMAVPAGAQDMATIDSFIQRNAEATNGGTEVFVGLRCSSLFMLMSIYASNNKLEDHAEKFSKSSENAFKFAAHSQDPKNIGYLTGQVELMLEAYKERLLKAKALTGNFSDDKIISADLKTCSDIF